MWGFLILTLAVVLCAPAAWARRTRIVRQEINVPEPAPIQAPQPQPAGPVEILQATGMRESLDGGGITLNVFGTLYSSPLSGDCVFLNERGTRVDRGAFVQQYLRRYVTVELEKDSGAVVSCRVGS